MGIMALCKIIHLCSLYFTVSCVEFSCDSGNICIVEGTVYEVGANYTARMLYENVKRLEFCRWDTHLTLDLIKLPALAELKISNIEDGQHVCRQLFNQKNDVSVYDNESEHILCPVSFFQNNSFVMEKQIVQIIRREKFKRINLKYVTSRSYI